MHYPIIDIVLILFLLISAYTDLKYRKVFNYTIVSLVILGIGLNYIFFNFAGLKSSFAGILSGFLFLFFFYLMGMVGAGDVKFLMAIGSLKGYEFTILGAIYGTIVGGIFALVLLVLQKKLFFTFKKILWMFQLTAILGNTEPLKIESYESKKIPYAVFLSVGMFVRWLEVVLR